MEQQLWFAAQKGKVGEVRRLLETHGRINVNWRDQFGWTVLHIACASDREFVLPLLLVHPDLDMNQRNDLEGTAFTLACRSGSACCIRLLVRDSRVSVNERDHEGYTTLFHVLLYGRLDTIKWMIACGKPLDLGEPGNPRTDAIGNAIKVGWVEAADLLNRFRMSPAQIREEVRRDLGYYRELAVNLFALVIFVSDGLLQPKALEGDHRTRFFAMAIRLPLELQMVLCYRGVGSLKTVILTADSETAFQNLSRLV